MTLISSTRFFNGALLAGAMALISTEVAVAQLHQAQQILQAVWFRRGIKLSQGAKKWIIKKLLLKTVTALRWPQMCIFQKIAGTRSLLRLLFPGLLAR